MGRHHDRKYGYGSSSSYGSGYGRYGMRTGGLGALVPLIGLGAVAAIIFAFLKKRTFGLKGFGWKSFGWKNQIAATGLAATTGVAVANQNCATVGFNEKLIAAERLPGVKYREVDVITRKRIPLHEVREIYEGPAQMEVFEGTQREYVAPDVGCATGGYAAGGYAAGYGGQQCTTTCAPTGGIAAGGWSSGFGLKNKFWRGNQQVNSGTTITNN